MVIECEYCGAELASSPCRLCGEDAVGQATIEWPDRPTPLHELIRPLIPDDKGWWVLDGRLVKYRRRPPEEGRVIAIIPDNYEVVCVPGWILTPGADNYAVDYLGPAETIRRVREEIRVAEDAAARAVRLLEGEE